MGIHITKAGKEKLSEAVNERLRQQVIKQEKELKSVRARLGAATKKVKRLNVLLHETTHEHDLSKEDSMKLESCWIQEPFMKFNDAAEEITKLATPENYQTQHLLTKNSQIISSLEDQVKNLINERDDLHKKNAALEAANGHLIAALYQSEIAHNI